MQTACPADPLDTVPDPTALRTMIAEHVRKADLLRQLLRLSIRRERLREQPTSANVRAVSRRPEREAVAHAS